MKHQLIFVLLLLIPFCKAFSQGELYFYKIQNVSSNEHLASKLYEKLDSLKYTRRPQDSKIRILFNRDIDFGYRQERIDLTLNGTFYQVNLLVKNDTVCLSSTLFKITTTYDTWFNKKHSIPKIDTVRTLNFLKLRNQFYSSFKTLIDLKNELDLNEIYALRGGDGYLETWDKKHIDTLVNTRNLNELETMLKSINCERQTYGVTGFNLLKKKRVKIPAAANKLIEHIKNRNSELESCEGDLCPVIWKAYK